MTMKVWQGMAKFNGWFIMEDVLTTLCRDATSGKLKTVRDACNAATGE